MTTRDKWLIAIGVSNIMVGAVLHLPFEIILGAILVAYTRLFPDFTELG